MKIRSLLFTPGDRADRFDKAFRSEADGVILDLEDAVAPDAKSQARRNVMQYLASGAPRSIAAVRINSLSTVQGLMDVLALADSPRCPGMVMLPKTEEPGQVRQLRTVLGCGGQPPMICALVESAAGLQHAADIAKSGASAIAFGAADYVAELGAMGNSPLLAVARARIVEAAASAGIPAIDAPCFSLKDTEAVSAEARDARSFGFAGKLAVHPSQIAAINAAFTPGADEIEWARRVLAENGKGAGNVDGGLVDEAVARRARRLLAVS